MTLFGVSVSVQATPGGFSLAMTWSRIARVAPPGPTSDIAAIAESNLPVDSNAAAVGKTRRQVLRVTAGATVAVTLGLFTLALAQVISVGPMVLLIAVGLRARALALKYLGPDIGPWENALAAAERGWITARDRWMHETSDDRFHECKQKLEAVKKEIEGLPAEREKEMQKLRRDIERRQKQKFLRNTTHRKSRYCGHRSVAQDNTSNPR